MNLIKTAIDRPIAVVAAVLMTVMFGLVSLKQIPIQLTPDVNKPEITITTIWPGAAPAEVEREIINKQEEEFAGLEGLESITSRAEQGRGRVTLEFGVGSNMDRSLLLVANRLDRVADYPDESKAPNFEAAGSEDNAIAWFILTRREGNETPIHQYGDFVEDVVRERVERVPGVGRVNVFGTSSREMQVVLKPQLLARYGLTVVEVTNRLRASNASVSAGDVDEGKRRYVVRTEGELNTLEAVKSVVLRSINDAQSGRTARVLLGDVADVVYGFRKPTATIRLMGESAVAFNAERQGGANVIETMRGIRAAVDELNQSLLPDAGLELRQVYDETIYINAAIDLVRQNIWIGGVLAAIVLLLFLRSIQATLIVSIAIPVSVIGAFVAMAALGRSINVISLAGLAFAVGMVVDAAIVVMENIYRHREKGMTARRAAYEGARQVWGAVLVSALTTVMVFIPILVMKLEAGQLFRDIAVAISVAVVLSLVVSITVIPALSRRLLGILKNGGAESAVSRLRIPVIDTVAFGFVRMVLAYTRIFIKAPVVSILVVGAITVIAAFLAVRYIPPLDYLPSGNRNLIIGFILPPPGYNLETTSRMAERIETATRPYWASYDGAETADDDAPKINRFFFVALRANTILGAVAKDPSRVRELIPILQSPIFKEPGTFGFIRQRSIFGRGIGGSNKIDLDISGFELETILDVALQAFGRVNDALPQSEGYQLRPQPGLTLGAPEVRVVPDRLRLADSGVTARDLAASIDAFNDGLRAAEVTVDGKLIDLIVKGPEDDITETQGIADIPIVTASGHIIPAGQLSNVQLTSGPTEIRHREGFRTVTVEIGLPTGVALETALNTLHEKVVNPMREAGLPAGVKLNVSGTADQLSETWDAILINLLLALGIVYLVMAVLFESFIYPLVILLSVPVAAAGGVGGLVILNNYYFQPLDMLTMLGFIILVGIVVNNAILLVHQTLLHMREDHMDGGEAILTATRNRIRPIFMSTLTSVFGMLPLVILPGAGSELYRGLGSVVIGGLSLSALLTLLIIPPLLALLVSPLERRRLAREQRDDPGSSTVTT